MMLGGVGNFVILISGDKPMDLMLRPLSDPGMVAANSSMLQMELTDALSHKINDAYNAPNTIKRMLKTSF